MVFGKNNIYQTILGRFLKLKNWTYRSCNLCMEAILTMPIVYIRKQANTL